MGVNQMKKEVNISGKVLTPLREGERAALSSGGQFVLTSPVVTIYEDNADYAYFETMNSVYKVCLQPIPIRATTPPFLRMCA